MMAPKGAQARKKEKTEFVFLCCSLTIGKATLTSRRRGPHICWLQANHRFSPFCSSFIARASKDSSVIIPGERDFRPTVIVLGFRIHLSAISTIICLHLPLGVDHRSTKVANSYFSLFTTVSSVLGFCN